jgi:hypothetical protein
MQTRITDQPQLRDALRDLCCIIADNPLLRDGVFRARASDLARRLDAGAAAEITGADLQLAVDMAEAVVTAVVGGRQIASPMATMRICERVVNPITDALGYPGDVRG